jgi:hypothetical protein
MTYMLANNDCDVLANNVCDMLANSDCDMFFFFFFESPFICKLYKYI